MNPFQPLAHPEEDSPDLYEEEVAGAIHRSPVADDMVACPVCETRHQKTNHRLLTKEGRHFWRITWACCPSARKTFVYNTTPPNKPGRTPLSCPPA